MAFEESDKDKNREDRPPRPKFLDSADEVLEGLGKKGKAKRKSKAEPGPRKTERYDSAHVIRYSIASEEGGSAKRECIAISTNVATHGMALKTSESLSVGDLLLLEIIVRNKPRVNTLGEVIHCQQQRDGTFESGVKFLDITDEDFELLIRLFP